jgi:ribosome biogenesis GTPase
MAEISTQEYPGRVIAVFGPRCEVETEDGEALSCTQPRHIKPVCGDRVRYQLKEDGGGHLSAIEPRDNSFPRVDRRGRPRVIAANLDLVFIVVAPEPAPTRFLVDRYLVAAHTVEVEPVLVANKADSDSHARLMERLSEYRDLGYTLLGTSAKTGEGLDELAALVRAGTGILAGQSGVGKSQLARWLLPGVEIATDQISHATGKGRHTTTTARLYHPPGGGSLIDSPGVWEYGLWEMPREEVERGFIEFHPHLDRCQFRDCRHVAEPNCAVKAAVEKGEISGRRWESYQQLLGEIKGER